MAIVYRYLNAYSCIVRILVTAQILLAIYMPTYGYSSNQNYYFTIVF